MNELAMKVDDGQTLLTHWDQYYKADFAVTQLLGRFWCCIWVAKYLFADAIQTLLWELQTDSAELHLQTQIMHQNIEVILQ